MNEHEIEKFNEIILDEIDTIKSNVAYVNGKNYFGLNSELLSYIRELEKYKDERDKYKSLYENGNKLIDTIFTDFEKLEAEYERNSN